MPGASACSADSFGVVRVARDPYISVLALITDAVGRRRGAPQAWRSRVLSALSPRSVQALLPLTTPRQSVTPESVASLNPACEIPVSDQLEWLHAISDDALLGDIHTVFGQTPPPHWQAALRKPRAWLDDYARAIGEAWQSVEPLWGQARPLLEREIERVGTAVVRGGLDLLLDGLHRVSRFDDGVLTLYDLTPTRVGQGERPLVLVPMLSGNQALICNLERPDSVWVGYPLPGASELSPSSRSTPRPAGGQLEAVTGPVRAHILRASERPLTMTALAKVTRLVPSALTYHCERLAAAGLIRRDRSGRQVWITRTSRGSELVALFAEED